MEKKPRRPSQRAVGPRGKRSAPKARKASPKARKASPRKRTARPTVGPFVSSVTPAPVERSVPTTAPAEAVAAAAPAVAPRIPKVPGLVTEPFRVRVPWRALAAFFAFAVIVTAIGSLVIRAVDAATFQGPTQAAPGGNIPLTIWNRAASAARQATAAIDIDGGGPGPTTPTGLSVGSNTLNLGNAAGGQNVFYGVADFAGMHAQDYLMLLQTAAAGPTYTTRFSVDKTGGVYTPATFTGNQLFIAQNASFGSANYVVSPTTANLIWGNMDTTSTGSLMLLQNESVDKFRVNARGDVKAAGCFGKTLVGLTASAYQPAGILSYVGADNRCNTDFPGSHMCKVEEILESIQCRQAGDPIITLGGNNAWIIGGPPGINTANANDCIGWTSSAASSFGRVWVFDNTTGGFGTLTGCNIGAPGLKIACCR